MFSEETYQEGYAHGKRDANVHDYMKVVNGSVIMDEAYYTGWMNSSIQSLIGDKKLPNAKNISDGYHTFQELYDMRLALTVLAFKLLTREWKQPISNINPVWKSKQHSDGTMFDGMFIVGAFGKQPFIGGTKYMISFHYHDEHWDKFDFAETLDKAPEWDGHTDKDVIERLLSL